MTEHIDISLPLGVSSAADALTLAGHDAVLVGGAVRDALLGREIGDYDLVTDATPATVRELCADQAGVRSVYALGERFGTVGIALEDGGTLEVTRYRDEALGAPSADERFARDAGLRDFTVNALGARWPGLELLDPTGGRDDLDAQLLRCPGDPAARLAEDPIRVLRAARFAAELGFALDDATREALPAAAPALTRVAVERMRAELTRTLVAPGSERGLGILRESGALAVVLPEVAALDGLAQPSFHDLDALSHTIQTVSGAPATPVLRWAALLHDVGKAPARSVEPDGRIRFFRHAQIGAQVSRDICERFKFSLAETEAIAHLVATHMRLGELDTNNERAVDRAVRRLDLWTRGPAPRQLVSAEDAVALTLADFGATAHREEADELRRVLEQAVAESRARGTAQAVHSTLTGAELMAALRIPEGPSVGVAKDAIADAIADGLLAPDDRAGALKIARDALADAGV